MNYTFQNDLYTQHFKQDVRAVAKSKLIYFLEKLQGQTLFKTPSVQFLYGHHLFADELDNFKFIVNFIAKNFTIVSYSEAVNLINSAVIDKNYICFSFDDGIRNNLRIADYFAEQNISAAFFINPEVVENSGNINYIKKHSIEKLHLKPVDFMTWKDVENIQKQGHEIGNHTHTHARLSQIADEQLEKEILFAKNELEKHCGNIKHFAWTYGTQKDISHKTIDYIINTARHESLASAIRGQHFEKLNLNLEYIKRDLIVFKDPLYFFNYFYRKANFGG